MLWIILSLTASIFYALRHVVIKKYLKDVDTLLMAFSYRFFSVLFLLPLLLVLNVEPTTKLFWIITFSTAVLTAVASILQIKAIQKYELSISVPFLAFVPLFMVLSVYLVYKELPEYYALIGIFILVAGSFILTAGNNNGKWYTVRNIFQSKGSVFFFIVAVIFGITSTIDRIAIEDVMNDGFTYTFYWHILSTILFSFIFFNKRKNKLYLAQVKMYIRGFVLQGVFGITAFLLQMLAIEKAFQLEANVLYIKAITLLQLLISVVFGIFLFKEKHVRNKLLGAVVMIIGALIIILSKKG